MIATLPNLSELFRFADDHGITLAGDPRSMTHAEMIDFADLAGRAHIIDHAVAFMGRTGDEMSADAWRLMIAAEMLDEWRDHIAACAMAR